MKIILLIEDNPDIRENTAEILELANYRVLTAENGKIGVEKALETKPDLVICDIMMPVLDGYGVLHIFNKNPDLADVPFIFLTAKTERADFRRGMEMGADDYLTKPFEEIELLNAVEGRLKRFNQMRPAYEPTKDGLGQFLDDAHTLTGIDSLLVDRKGHLIKKKQFVYSEGDEPTRLYFVQAGRVKTFKTNPDGKEFITGLYLPGDFFGYVSLLEQTDQTDSAVALEDTELVYIPKETFIDLVSRDSEVARRFVQLLANRITDREEQLLAMAYNSLRRRVADTLLRLHNSLQSNDNQPVIHFSRDDLAAMVGTATESLIRTLSEFKSDGLIDISGTSIRILQPEKLKRARW
ncbi:response regulator [Larkinella arboricola]|uniref:CRP-like cAMP-binding protein n=1 Tax=Larkinella arboricola TaxID=643671 RepID=A0A327X7Z3_LARAB|nr:response regulator [Larkinella arboricola]RAK02338.1 CRP-like cAMP-binding protein [Larkinella arboricola]